MTNKPPRVPSSNLDTFDSLFFLFSQKNEEQLAFFIDSKHLIKDLVLNTKQDYFLALSSYCNKPFSEVLQFLNLDKERLFYLMEETKTKLFKHIELSDNHLTYQFNLSIAYLEPNHILIFTLVDGSKNALKSYINSIINSLPGAIYWKDREGRYMGCNQFVAHIVNPGKFSSWPE